MATTLAIVAAMAFEPTALAQTDDRFDNIWHVDAQDGDDGNAGTPDWDDAFRTLQRALEAADPTAPGGSAGSDLIKVAQGTYEPSFQTDPPDERSATYLIDFLDVTIEGGYAGLNAGVDPNDRDPSLYETVLNGDLPLPPEPPCGDPGTMDCFEPDPEDLGCADSACCRWVCFDSPDAQPQCCLMGWDQSCADIALQECPRGVYNVLTIQGQPPGRVRIKGVTITGGGANGDFAGQGSGGGMRIQDASPSVVRCTFTGNGGGSGGAVAVVGDSSEPFFANCSFLRNTASSEGGAVRVDADTFTVLGPDPFFVNCVFSGNLTSGMGGAVFVAHSAAARLVNCTFSHNESGQGGAVFVDMVMNDPNFGVVCAINSIFWNNSPDQIFDVPGTALVSFSDVQGGGFAGDGNIDTDPIFENELGPDMDPGTGDEDLRLDLMSPANDAGSTARVPADVGDLDRDSDFNERTPFDLGDNLRIALANANAPSQCDRGGADLGAFEVIGRLIWRGQRDRESSGGRARVSARGGSGVGDVGRRWVSGGRSKAFGECG